MCVRVRARVCVCVDVCVHACMLVSTYAFSDELLACLRCRLRPNPLFYSTSYRFHSSTYKIMSIIQPYEDLDSPSWAFHSPFQRAVFFVSTKPFPPLTASNNWRYFWWFHAIRGSLSMWWKWIKEGRTILEASLEIVNYLYNTVLIPLPNIYFHILDLWHIFILWEPYLKWSGRNLHLFNLL